MTQKKMERHDWVDVFFEIQKELGLDIEFRFGQQKPGSKTSWQTLAHNQFDGIGGFAHLLRQNDWPITTLPKSLDNAPPSRLSMVLPMIRYALEKQRVKPVSWKSKFPEYKVAPIAVAEKPLSKEQTKTILEKAKTRNITVNTLLLESINRTAASFLQTKLATNTWVIPVNIRGAIERESDTLNHVSFFPVRINPGQSTSEIQRITNNNLRKKSQWVTWHFLTLTGNKKGRAGIRKMVESTLDEEIGVSGVFSNLGSWPQRKDQEPVSAHAQLIKDEKTWFFAPNITAAVPFGVGALTWRGRMGLTIQTHPYIGGDDGLCRSILESWVDDLLN